MIHQPKVELQERIKKQERIITFLGKNMRENNKIIENKMRKIEK